MREAPVDLAPLVKPFFYGWWAQAQAGVNTWLQLPITTIQWAQKGMVLSGGGCKVPIPGIYHVGGYARSDSNITAGPNYACWGLFVNGNQIAQTVRPNNNIGSYFVQYQEHQFWLPVPLNAGDVITCQGYSNPYGTTWYAGGGGWPGSGLRVLYDSPLPVA